MGTTAYDWVVRRRCRRSPTFSIKSYNTCCIVTLKSILNIVWPKLSVKTTEGYLVYSKSQR